MDYYKGTIPILDTAPACTDILHPRDATYGCVPRDYTLYPEEMFEPPHDMPLIPKSEWDARYDEQEATQSSLEHLYLSGPNGTPRFVNLDQNGHGYCWAYSTGHAVMMNRLIMNQPMVRLNPHSVAAIIKGGRDQGGWCGLSADFAGKVGFAEEGNGPGQWPFSSRDLRYDTPALRANMAKYRTLEEWRDLSRAAYDQNLSEQQYASVLLSNIPTPSDFQWWGHSVCAIRWVRLEAGSWGQLILNSWKGWGRHGLAVLRGDRTRTMGAVAIRTVRAA